MKATPVTDLRRRLRNAGVSEAQADAITGAFEALSSQIEALHIETNRRLDRLAVNRHRISTPDRRPILTPA